MLILAYLQILTNQNDCATSYRNTCVSFEVANILIFSPPRFILNADLHKWSAAPALVPGMRQTWREGT